MIGVLVLCFGFFFFVTILIVILRDRNITNGRYNLPPGSMGWPFIGETLQLYSRNPNIFFASKQKRYGEIFKTHILGCPCVMLAGPEAARFVLGTHNNLFKPTYPMSKERLIGPSAIFFHQGEYHSRIRRLVRASLSPEAIKKMVPNVESIALSVLESWNGGHVVNTFHEMKKFSFEVGIMAIFGNLEEHYIKQLKKDYCIVNRGYNSYPTNIPGTSYRKAILARKRLSKILTAVILERKEKKLLDKDLLGLLLNSKDENGEILDSEQISDNIIGVLFAAQDTTASVMTWILKYLHDNPKLLQAVKAEQEAICESDKEESKPMSWAKIRQMPFTSKVVLETLRMSSIISFTFREAVEDVEYKGYLIPKGWKVMPLFRNIHHNPEYFIDPEKFDPSRFEVAPKPNTFMPFGSGIHSCPGNELAKLEILILIHHLVTKFRWEVVGTDNGIHYGPFPVPAHGLPATFWKESSIPGRTWMTMKGFTHQQSEQYLCVVPYPNPTSHHLSSFMPISPPLYLFPSLRRKRTKIKKEKET